VSDVFTRYELALEQLLARLGPKHPRAAEARTLQARLLDNIAAARLHGDTETRRAERSEVRAALDLLAGEELNITFNELAFSPARAAEAGEAPVAMAGRVFLAYSHQDESFVLHLAANLRDRGAPLWVDRWDILPGTDWDQAIDAAAYDCGRFLIVLSPAAVESPDVRGELRIALAARKPIVPVLYRTCRIPRQLQLVQYVDFTAGGPDDGPALRAVLGALGVAQAAPLPRSLPEQSPKAASTGTGEAGPPAPRPTAVEASAAPPGKTAPAAAAEKAPATAPAARPRQPFEPELVRVPVGKFLLGSDPRRDGHAQEDEQPQQRLYLPEYFIARTPVTNAQYAAFVRAARHRAPKHWEQGQPPAERTDHPVVNVSWHDALAYCRWLAEATGRPYTLPTEAQWEKAARGPDGRLYPWGDEFDKSRCNTDESGIGGTTPVGRYSPAGDSPYGCADMVGNVREWCLTKWRGNYKTPEDNDPAGNAARVLRGGSWDVSRWGARAAFRYGYGPHDWGGAVGFRCVLSPGG